MRAYTRKFLPFFNFIISVLLLTAFSLSVNSLLASAKSRMPFYDLKPQNLVLRSEFYTTFSSSIPERKRNIKRASIAINKVFVDVGGEFSFNRTVGPRTIEKGYENSKIIVNGQFVDGVGGGVCQVSTTLYNAVLLAGLKITEYHPHSLPVSYVSPSFDAMVSYGGSDLRFINDTHNPIIIYSYATDDLIRIEIYGEPNDARYIRQSVIVGEIPAPAEEEFFDANGDYPEILLGEKKVIRYSKSGLKSQGYLLKVVNGVTVDTKKIRTDIYNAVKGLIVYGSTPPIQEPNKDDKLDFI